MKQFLTLLLVFQAFLCSAQPQPDQTDPTPTEEVATEIKANRVFDLSVIQIYPDQYPEVSVVFQAKDRNGKPLWTLDKSEISVLENGEACEVLDLKNISEDKPVNIGLVFDHSSSMLDIPLQFYDPQYIDRDVTQEGPATNDGVTYNGYTGELLKGAKPAIEFAKGGVYEFLKEMGTSNDSILFVGFSTKVDKVLPLTNSTRRIKRHVKGIEASGTTAFFDAVYRSIEELSQHTSKGVIVALTDGADNESKHSYEEVIDFANEKGIAVYCIGLGTVSRHPLEDIALETNGLYYYTNNAEQLSEIYRNIKDQIRSIYQVDYTSASSDYLKVNRRVSFKMLNDTLAFSENVEEYPLPEEAIAYLKEMEETGLAELRQQERDKMLLVGGGAFGILLLGAASFVAIRKRRKKNQKQKIVLAKAYPNPFRNNLTVEFQLPEGTGKHIIRVTNMEGTSVAKIPVSPPQTSKQLNLGQLSSGMYLIQIGGPTGVSNVVKVMKEG